MIRASSVILAGLVTSACGSLPGLAFPELRFRPEYGSMQLRGDSRMQSAPGGGPIVNNPSMTVDEQAGSSRDDDYGGRLSYGDGFSGFEFGYMRFVHSSTDRATMPADWGAVPAGTEVSSEFRMDEYRFSYTAQVWEFETENEIRFRTGLGVKLAHRNAKYSVREIDNGPIAQDVRFKDKGVPYITGRLRGEYRGFAAAVDYGWSDLDFGGDFDGPMQDFEATISYALVDQDITFLAGYRFVELPASGTQDGFAYDIDFELDGYLLGIEVKF